MKSGRACTPFDANAVRIAVCLVLALSLPALSGTALTISGLVRDANAPIAGATVRVQATDYATATDADGRFALAVPTPDEPVVLTAWARGYYIAASETSHLPGASNVEIVLTAHTDQDNQTYRWRSASTSLSDGGSGEDNSCENCHCEPNDPLAPLPFNEWRRDAHSLSARNPRFLTMYSGGDVFGNQSPPTRHVQTRDYGRIPVRPDPNEPYYGPGYKLDFPDTAGNCAACHSPAAAIDAAYTTDPTKVAGVGAQGVGCDFCHKVWDVRLDPTTGAPYSNMPGVLSFEFRRPPKGHQFFAGPLDDVAPGEDTYSLLQRQSQYCAPCHFGTFWGTQVYNSFGEWLDSPYSDPRTPKTCQDCHMPAGKTDHFAHTDKGGLIRDPQTIFSHRMPGAADENLLQNAVTMDVKVDRAAAQLVVNVAITNDKTGHHVPTDSPLRHLILIVRALDEQGHLLAQTAGPKIPKWAGAGDPDEGYYAGLPGKTFAKVLEELWTEVSPSGAYWNPTRVLSDNRLAAFATDVSSYTFEAPAESEIAVDVTLVFRRAFIELANQKGWDVPDIVMGRKKVGIAAP